MLTQVQILRAPPPLKFGRAKNVQNLVRFTTTFEFDRKYFWNWRRQQQSLNGVDENDFFGVEKKIGKFLSPQAKLYALKLSYPKSTMRVRRMRMHFS